MEINVSRGTVIADPGGNIIEYKNDQFFKFKRATIPPEAVNGIRDFLGSQDLKWQQGRSGMEQSLDDNLRKSEIAWVEDDGLKSYIFSQFESANTDDDWRFDIDSIEDIQYTKYYGNPEDPINGHYTWHTDMLMSTAKPKRCRKLSMTMMLSQVGEDYEGGTFEFQCLKSGNIDYQQVKLNMGDVLVFPSTMSHRVNFVTHGVRSVLVAWAWGPIFK